MKAVFLDQATFGIPTPSPSLVSEFVCYDDTAQDDNLIITRCQDADIIITNKVPINENTIKNLPNLKLVQISATGINNVDKSALDARQIALQNVAGYAHISVPEHTIMLILNAMRALVHYHTAVIDGTWQQSGQFCLHNTPILDLHGKTLGIIGAGTIGKKVGEIAKSFGMRVLYAEHQHKPPRNQDYTAFDDVLAVSDIISLHTPLTDKTYHLINDKTLTKMHKKPLIVNTARGDVVDSHTIVKAIKADTILGYATDVFCQEPPQNDPLLTLKDHPRVIFSPHNAWASQQAQTTLWQILCQNVDRFITIYQKY